MKIVYSQLKKFLPDLNKEPAVLRDDLTMIGHFTNYYEKQGNDIVFDLDIKVNRGDCLGYYGLARDLSVYYNIPIVLPNSDVIASTATQSLPIQINSPDVKRIQAIKLTGLQNTPSPEWLINFLSLHKINSINALVDLTNYVMLLYSIPCHAFDCRKTGDNLTWENNTSLKFSDFISLDGTTLKLNEDNLVISNGLDVLSLSFIGGQNSGIETSTTDTILEMAIYDRTRVRRDSRGLKTVTEASIRLEKDLDTETIPLAFSHLVSLVQQLLGGKIVSSLYENYQVKPLPVGIPFNPRKPSEVSGIDISSEFAFDCLRRLGCTFTDTQVIPPSIRKDLTLEEDLVEEVIRFFGYQNIPQNQPVAIKEVTDITPKVLYLIEQLKDKLIALGYDEVLSWPLVQTPLSDNSVKTQNSINSEYPYLRQSIVQSLKTQLDQYQRYKLPYPQFFEIGKVFRQKDGQYQESYSLGLYHYAATRLSADLAQILPSDQWHLTGNFAEIILDHLEAPEKYVPKNYENNAVELTTQIISLDANVTLSQEADPTDLIRQYAAKIDSKLLWQIQITDIYHDDSRNLYRYTFRVYYYNCDDKTAKSVHLFAFDLDK